jgi:Fe-S-cluster containining protein
MQSFFTFPDRALRYDCPSCGSFCCKGKGVALEAREEVVRFARLEPRLAALIYPYDARFAQVLDVTDGCWMLKPDGLCAIELTHGYAAKPHTCRLFPFNRIFRAGEVRVVDFNSKICPLQDAADARDGQGWAELQKQIDGEGESFFGRGEVAVPAGGAELGWVEHERWIRDAIDAHLAEPDYAAFAALQEEGVVALLQKKPLPSPRAETVLARAASLRRLLASYRAHHGVTGAPGLAEAARLAARQATLLTCSWRLSMLLSSEAAPYPHALRMLPRHLLAASHLIELSHLARQTPPGLRAATETFQGAAPLIGMLALFPQRARIKKPLEAGLAREVQPALQALSGALLQGGRTLGEIAASLAEHPVHLRAMALTALAFGNAELIVE